MKGAKCSISGGTITNNGLYGIQVENGATIEIAGNPQIINNKSEDLYLCNDVSIVLGEMKDTAKIAVNTQKIGNVAITQKNEKDLSAYFISKDDNRIIKNIDNVVTLHIHDNWKGATCTSLGICETCGDKGGELDSTNHSISKIWKTDGEKHWRECEYGCGTLFEVGNHTQGTATCLDAVYCEICGIKYSEINPSNHALEETYFKYLDNFKHGKYHSCCDVLIEEGEHTPAEGYVATCTGVAKCKDCNNAYGGTNETNHTGQEVYVSNGNQGHIKKYECCGKIILEESHTLTYRVESNHISATCSACGVTGSVMMSLADKNEYTGHTFSPTIITDGIFSGLKPFETPVISGCCEKGCINAGIHTKTMTMGNGENIASISTEFTITQKPLELKSVTVFSKSYDGNNKLDVIDYHLDGIVTYSTGSYSGEWDDIRDDVGLAYNKLEATASDSIPDKNYDKVTVTGIELKGNDVANYSIAYSQKEDVTIAPILGQTQNTIIYKAMIWIQPQDQTLYGNDAVLDQSVYYIDGLEEQFAIEGISLYEETNTTIGVNRDNIKITLDGTDVTQYFNIETLSANLTRVCEGHEFDENGFCSTGSCNTYQEAYLNNNGTSDDEGDDFYQIYNAGQLYWFAEQVNTYNKNSINGRLMTDITVNENLNAEQLREWTPIGSSSPAYCGAFDGKNHTVSGLYVKNPSVNYVGLFGFTDYTNSISNIHLTNSYLEGNSYVGGLFGYASSCVSGCSISDTVTVKGNSAVGGVVGSAINGNMSNCWSDATVTVVSENSYTVGGLVGNNDGKISNCYTTKGILAYYNSGRITNCYYLAETIEHDDNCGGTTAKTSPQFASGEVAYLLQEGVADEEVWGQDIKEDENDAEYDIYPVLGGAKVYLSKIYDCPNDTEVNNGYSNKSGEEVRAKTHPNRDGDCKCDICGETVHTDTNSNGECDNCKTILAYIIAPTSRLLGTDETVANISMNPSNGYVKTGNDVTLNAPNMLRYTFKGWYLSSDIDSTSHQIIEGKTAVSTSFVYTFKPSTDMSLVAVYEAEEKEATITFTENANFTVTINGKEVSGTQNEDTYSVSALIGSQVTVTVTDESFINWCNDNGKIVTTKATYTFTVTGDVTLKMSKEGKSKESAMVEFVSDYNQIIASQLYNSNTSIIFPIGPSKMGYRFTGWNLTQEEIHAKIDAGETHIKVTPVYVQDETKYTITVYVDGEVNDTLSVKNVSAGEGKTVYAPSVDGKNFLYWTDEKGRILGYDTSYFMQVNKDIIVKAVYGEEEVEKKPVIAMTNVYTTIENEKNRISFSVTRDIPDGYTLVAHGIIANRTGFENPTADNFILGAADVTKFTATTTLMSGVYTLNVNMTGKEGVKVVARGYLVVKNNTTGNEEVYYTEVASYSYNDISSANQ